MKKTIFLTILGVLISLVIIGSLIYFFFFQKQIEQPPVLLKERTLEEKLQDLTASAGEAPEVSEEIIQSLTSSGRGEVSEDTVNKLTAP